jgi:hypothetical protein
LILPVSSDKSCEQNDHDDCGKKKEWFGISQKRQHRSQKKPKGISPARRSERCQIIEGKHHSVITEVNGQSEIEDAQYHRRPHEKPHAPVIALTNDQSQADQNDHQPEIAKKAVREHEDVSWVRAQVF